MMLDKKSLDMLLSLDDKRLAMIIGKIASDAGIDPGTLKLGKDELAGIRAALSMATDSDLTRATELFRNYKNGKKGSF
jgi:hypothetical protein